MRWHFDNPDFFNEQVRQFSVPGSNSYVHVLLHSANGYDERESGAEQCTEPFSIGDRLWLCRLSNELRDVVYKACEPQGEPYEKVYRQFGQLYTIALFVGPAQPGTGKRYESDGAEQVGRTVGMDRFC